MPIVTTVDATWMNTPSFTAQEIRRADSAMFNGDGGAFSVYGGIVRHGDLSLTGTVSAADLVTVRAGAVVINGDVGVNGCYRCASFVNRTATLDARNATNPRIDLVVFRALDTDVVASHAAYTGQIEIITGTAAASPAAPALPSMAVELFRINVPASGGGNATIDNSFRRYATALGGRLAVQSAALLPTTDAKWDRAVALDTGATYVWDGTTWVIDDTGFTAITLTTNLQPFNGFSSPAYRRIGTRVHLRGLIQATAAVAAGKTLATLPAGFRPTATELFAPQSSATGARLDVQADGQVNIQTAIANTGYISLSGVSFSTD